MDLSFVKEQLETFATFAGAIKDFLQLPPQILDQLSSLSSDAPEAPEAPEAPADGEDSAGGGE
ncbi:PorH family porin [Corynebacterium stationis]|uniref:PorH family porin n=1 Tax=Corynebacterium stationis TaxID=1705 RepID=A0AB36CJG1_9CORY|nr:PorH family porin [Corynebacterium stationis]NME88834.1 PorH family porin [Corynebacterium stationis]